MWIGRIAIEIEKLLTQMQKMAQKMIRVELIADKFELEQTINVS